MLIFFMTLLPSANNNDNPHTSSHKGYLKTIRWETSRDCQYSSGTKLVWTRKQLISLNATQNTTTLALNTPVESHNHVLLAVLFLYHHMFGQHHLNVLSGRETITCLGPTVFERRVIFLWVQLRMSFPQFHFFHFIPKFQTWSDVLHQDIVSFLSPQTSADIIHLSGCKSGVISQIQRLNQLLRWKSDTLHFKYTILT